MTKKEKKQKNNQMMNINDVKVLLKVNSFLCFVLRGNYNRKFLFNVQTNTLVVVVVVGSIDVNLLELE